MSTSFAPRSTDKSNLIYPAKVMLLLIAFILLPGCLHNNQLNGAGMPTPQQAEEHNKAVKDQTRMVTEEGVIDSHKQQVSVVVISVRETKSGPLVAAGSEPLQTPELPMDINDPDSSADDDHHCDLHDKSHDEGTIHTDLPAIIRLALIMVLVVAII